MSGSVRYPRPLRRGDTIGITAPSAGIDAGIDAGMQGRFAFAVSWLQTRGYEVSIGDCLDGSGVVSAPASARAAELTEMLIDPQIGAIVPPWGGELAVEILPHLDFDAISTAEPTWLLGYSDMSTILVPLTKLTGVAALYGQNLMDTPSDLPEEVLAWTQAATAAPGAHLAQAAARMHRSAAAGHGNYREDPTGCVYTLDEPGGWRRLGPSEARVDVHGRLIGGCLEVLAAVAGSPYGDVPSFAERCAPDGLIVYVDASESHALDIARDLWSLRLAGWFAQANAVLVARSTAPDTPGFTREDALVSALGDLGVPVLLDVDCGHVPPQSVLINAATAHVVFDGAVQTIGQTLD